MKSIRWLMVLPFVGMLGGIPFVNKVEPYVFGMPLLLFWLVAWKAGDLVQNTVESIRFSIRETLQNQLSFLSENAAD